MSRDPVFHFVPLPFFGANFLQAIYLTAHDWPAHARSHAWSVLLAMGFLLLTFTVRRYAAKNQDRIIRLEERLRLASLLSPADAAASAALTTRQLIALRFASDAELPALAERARIEELPPAEVKKAIASWRADVERI